MWRHFTSKYRFVRFTLWLASGSVVASTKVDFAWHMRPIEGLAAVALDFEGFPVFRAMRPLVGLKQLVLSFIESRLSWSSKAGRGADSFGCFST